MESKFFDKKNKSTVFVLPLVEDMPKVYFSDCVNCYIGSEFSETQGELGVIYVAFTKKSIEGKYYTPVGSNRAVLNSNRVAALTEHPSFLDVTPVELFYVYGYTVRDIYLDDIWNFLNGKYTQISKKAKQRMVSYYADMPKLRKILNPSKLDKIEFLEKLYDEEDQTPDLSVVEILSKPNWEQETFKLSHFLIIEE